MLSPRGRKRRDFRKRFSTNLTSLDKHSGKHNKARHFEAGKQINNTGFITFESLTEENIMKNNKRRENKRSLKI